MTGRPGILLAVLVAIFSGCGDRPGSGSSPTAPTLTAVSAQTITNISISPSALTIEVGVTASLIATAFYGDGTSGTVEVSWGTSDPSVASVNDVGVVTGHKVGTATINATFGAHSGSISVNVREALSVSSVLVVATASRLRVGEIMTVTATVEYSDRSSQQVTPIWSSSEPGIATVNPAGVVTAVGVGMVVITATFEGTGGSVNIDVSEAVSPSRVSVDAKKATLFIFGNSGETTTVTAEAHYTDGSHKQVTANWQSSNPNIASVSSDGTVRALGVGNRGSNLGSTEITATYGSVSGSISIVVAQRPSSLTGLWLGTTTDTAYGICPMQMYIRESGSNLAGNLSGTWSMSCPSTLEELGGTISGTFPSTIYTNGLGITLVLNPFFYDAYNCTYTFEGFWMPDGSHEVYGSYDSFDCFVIASGDIGLNRR